MKLYVVRHGETVWNKLHKVQITGAFTPQQRKTLEAYIEENLAIGKERQIWTNK